MSTIKTMVLVVCSWCGTDIGTKTENVSEHLTTDECVEFGSICNTCLRKELDGLDD